MNKLDQLKALAPTLDTLNRLFFQARNLAIESMLLRLQSRLLEAGYPAQCVWREASNQAPRVSIRMLNVSRATSESWEYGECVLYLQRDLVPAPDAVSQCYYRVKRLEVAEYWRGKQPAKLVKFRDYVSTLGDAGYFETEVAKLNYPFEYESHSVY